MPLGKRVVPNGRLSDLVVVRLLRGWYRRRAVAVVQGECATQRDGICDVDIGHTIRLDSDVLLEADRLMTRDDGGSNSSLYQCCGDREASRREGVIANHIGRVE